MNDDSWIKCYRKIREWRYRTDPEIFSVWMYLLLHAYHKERYQTIGNQNVLVKRGQVPVGRYAISEETGVEPSKVVRILNKLKSEHQIEQQTTNKFSMITIVNWEQYQNNEQQSEQRVNNECTPSEQRVNTIKNVKKVKKVKNDKKTKYNINTSICAEDYQKILTDPELANNDRAYLLRCCKEMQDWSANNPPKSDWAAALRNWIRRDKKTNAKFKASQNGFKSKQQSIAERNIQAVLNIEAMENEENGNR